MVSVTINTIPVSIKNLSIDLNADGRSTAQFTVEDATGTLTFVKNQKVLITDTNFSYIGFVHSTKTINLFPNINTEISVDVIDEEWYSDKRFYQGIEYTDRFAGDIAADLLNNPLSQEGISASYAVQNNQKYLDWQKGIQNNTVASTNISGGDLELASSGQDIEYDLPPVTTSSMSVIKYTGYASSGYSQAYAYTKIWSGSQAFTTGATIAYEVWISSSSPQIMAGIDLIFSDGTTLRSYALGSYVGTDGQGIGPDPANDLSGFANDTWYSRGHGISLNATIVGVSVGFGGTNQGTYTAYFRRIKLFDSNGNLIKSFFDDNSSDVEASVIMNNVGYTNISATAEIGYEKTADVVYNFDFSSVKIAKNSLVIFDVTKPKDSAAAGSIQLFTSLDSGGTFQECTSAKSIPNLFSGANVDTRILSVRQRIVQGIYADQPTGFEYARVLVKTAANSAIPTVFHSFSSKTQFQTGQLSNLIATDGIGLSLNGIAIPFSSTSDYVGVTTQFGSGYPYIQKRQLALSLPGIGDSKVRLDAVGTKQNFVAEVGCYISTNASDGMGLVYRTTNWGTQNNSYGYSATINQTQVLLAKGSNSTGAGSYTILGSVSLPLQSQSWHTLKVQVQDSTHMIFVDDVLLITVNDSSYTTGQIALRYYNSASVTTIAYFSNFGVSSAYSGQWSSAGIDLSFAKSYGNSFITWDTSGINSNASIHVRSTVDNQTGQDCIIDSPIPNLQYGQSLLGITLYLTVTIITGNSNVIPTMSGLTVWISSPYYASGSWMSIPLSLSPVPVLGDSLISWVGSAPEGTNIYIDSSLDGNNWTEVGNTNTGFSVVPGITGQPDAIVDGFIVNTSSDYISTSGTVLSGGGI